MTTKVVVTCPDTSHWDIKVITEDRVYNRERCKYEDEWKAVGHFVLKPTESRETFIHSSRRLMVVEVDRELP